VFVITGGAAKSDLLADVLGPERDPRRWPVQLARRRTALWLLDAPAAAGIRAGRDATERAPGS
jgi:6-phosphogluconolactonase/glucosamine-6-phosphate isomerase/deaminase